MTELGPLTCSHGHPCPTDDRYCGRCGEPIHDGAAPIWRTAADAIRVIAYRPHLGSTIATALIVGTILFCINQLDVLLAGDATGAVWLKTALNYVVPFGVSNIGILIATKRPMP